MEISAEATGMQAEIYKRVHHLNLAGGTTLTTRRRSEKPARRGGGWCTLGYIYPILHPRTLTVPHIHAVYLEYGVWKESLQLGCEQWALFVDIEFRILSPKRRNSNGTIVGKRARTISSL